MAFLSKNVQGLYDKLRYDYYKSPALTPSMPWLDNTPPTHPKDLTIENKDGYITLRWQPSTDNDTVNPPRYIVYASDTYPVDISNPENILAAYVPDCSYTYAPLYPWKAKLYYAVTAIDRYGNESIYDL